MKKQAFMVLTTLSMFVTLAAVSASAQSDLRLKANIPFEFSVGKTIFPAGEYTVLYMAHNVLRIESADYKRYELLWTIPTEALAAPEESKLVFNRYGDQYFLSKIWTAGNDIGRELVKSRGERDVREARSAVAKNASERHIVLIIAHR